MFHRKNAGILEENVSQKGEKGRKKDALSTRLVNTRFEQMFRVLKTMEERKESYRNS